MIDPHAQSNTSDKPSAPLLISPTLLHTINSLHCCKNCNQQDLY